MQQSPGTPTAKTRILVCDDDKEFSEVLATILGEYTVARAASGGEALEKLPVFAPDLVLLDVQMHDIDGYEVCRRIRTNDAFRFVKIVFVSGNVTLSDRMAGYKAGGDDYITKPFDTSEFLAKVAVLTRLKAVEEVDQIKKDFMALISHETRTPLTVIRGMTELLLENYATMDAGERQHLLKRIQRAAVRLSQLSEKTLLACQLRDLGHNRFPLSRTFSISDVVGNTIIEADDFLNECGVRLDHDVEDALLAGHRSYLGKALSYVLENAIRFSAKGGSVNIRGRSDGLSYRLSVSDRGPGIRPEHLAQIFELFSIKDIVHHSAGLGISLALASRIAELSGGSLTAASEPGQGSTFTFRIPISADQKNEN
jgi:signal transduction histidine kinase